MKDSMKRFYFILFSLLIFVPTIFSQQLFYSTIINGGVTGTGFGIYNNSSITKSVNIPLGSTIKRAFLLAEREREADDIKVQLNGVSYVFNAETAISNKFIGYDAPPCIGYNSTINAIDITNEINPTTVNYTLQAPFQEEECLNGAYYGFYLYIVFEKSNLPKTVCNLFINNQDVNINNSYNLESLMPIDDSKDVGLGIETFFFCDTTHDGSYISVNNDTLGLVGGSELLEQNCSGVSSHFSYYNNNLIGIDNSIPNNSMSGTDALADIKDYVNYFDTSVNVAFSYKSPQMNGKKSNPVLLLMLTYTSPCDTFSATVTSDTTICYGEQLQLNATGGQTYKWATSSASVAQDTSGTNDVYGLSCSNCPNPIFSGDSSAVYTVRIWNNDSCSVVKPVRVGVSHPQKINVKMFRSICSFSTGKITVEDLPDKVVQLGAINPSGDTINPNSGNTFTGLTAGDYSVFYVDTFGCSADTLITVEPIIDTEAAFRTNPIKGTAPIQINLTNQSQNATDYSWWINDEYQGNSLSGFYTDTSGVYDIELIAWKNDSICADTVSFTVIVFDSLVASLPNIFTPNKDGTNDFFNVSINLPVRYQLSILNRWGNVVFKKEGDLQKGTHDLWNGRTQSGELVTDGTYFYAISFELDSKLVDCEITNCEVKKEGFLEVRK